MLEQLLIVGILVGMLGLFVQGKVRPDAVALLGLLACYLAGLLSVREALDGFSSRAVLTVAAVLIIGRVMEVTGAASGLARIFVPRSRFVTVRLGAILLIATILSAFINNIAALVIMMPATIAIAREHRLPPAALLMSLAFATVVGGMTTLIGTPGNLILSSVREDSLGAPFGLFDMTYVGSVVAGSALVYLLLVGWRLTPRRAGAEELDREPVRVFELAVPDTSIADDEMRAIRKRLRSAGGVLLALFRSGERKKLSATDPVCLQDRLLVMSKQLPWVVAKGSGLRFEQERSTGEDAIVAQVTVSHGSRLVGRSYGAVRAVSGGQLKVVSVGPRPAKLKQPLSRLQIEPGDQLFIDGAASVIRPFLHDMSLLEIGRESTGRVSTRNAFTGLAIYAVAVIAAGAFALPVSIVMICAALTMCLLRLIPSDEIYQAIDWPIIVLLAAMIPIGRAFDDSGATQTVANMLSFGLEGASLPLTVAVLCAVSMILSSFLNNVATALVMGEVAVKAAISISLNVDAALLAVLIGSSCSFLTPIGHQNNLLVMRAGGYQFLDYARVGLPLTIIVIGVTTFMLTSVYG